MILVVNHDTVHRSTVTAGAILSSGRHHWERAARPRPVSLRGRRRVWRVGVEFRITGITWLGVVGDASGVFD